MVQIYKTEQENRFIEIFEKESPHYKVVDLDLIQSGLKILRVFIDRVDGTPVSLENCVEVDEFITTLVEQNNLIEGRYELEVSSPGLERRLRLETDFEKNIEKRVQFKFVEKIELVGAKTVGILKEISKGLLKIDVDKKEHQIPIQKVKLAHIVY
jgi:ribosome maturation factor RimP